MGSLNCGWEGEQPEIVKLPRVAWENPFVPEAEMLCPNCGKPVEPKKKKDEWNIEEALNEVWDIEDESYC